MKKQIEIKNDGPIPVPVEVLAESIRDIADNMKKLRSGPLNDRCLVLLIQDAIGFNSSTSSRHKISRVDIRLILDSIQNLEKEFLK